MTTETTFIPIDIIDISTIDPTLSGIDTTITTESIRAASQPLSFADGSLTIEANATIGDLSLVSLLPNPNLSNQIVIPQLLVGGTMMANDIILGNSGTTKFISDDTGTYIYNNLSVSGVINNTDLNNKLNTKSNNIIQAPATITLGQPADFTYFVDANSNSYPLFSSNDIVWSKNQNNVYLNISNEFKSNYATVGSIPTNYLTSGSLLDYATNQTLVNNYATQLELSEKVDYTTFEQQLSIARDSAISNSNAYADNKLTSYITSFSPLSGTYLSIIDGANTYQLSGNYLTNASLFQASGNYLTDSSTFQLSGNYLTDSSVFQLSGNYLTNASLFQLSGNYLTNASTFQLSGNYITTFTPLSGTYLSIIDAGATYQTKAGMTNYITSGSLTKASVGLGNVDNTSDANKPASIATQSLLNSYLSKPMFGGRFNNSLNTLTTFGQQSFTLSKPRTGAYGVSFTTPHPNGAAYGVFVSVRGGLTISYGIPGSSGFEIYSYTLGTAMQVDLPQDCSFFTLP